MFAVLPVDVLAKWTSRAHTRSGVEICNRPFMPDDRIREIGGGALAARLPLPRGSLVVSVCNESLIGLLRGPARRSSRTKHEHGIEAQVALRT